jgi:hypothetical protein
VCAPALAQQSADFFESQIRPVLAANCFSCHGAAKMGGLRLDSREHLAKGGQSGPVIVSGDPGKSLLIQAVRRTHERIKMPPQGKLEDREIENLVAWVKQGAVWPDPPARDGSGHKADAAPANFWAFQPVRKPPVPQVSGSAATDIDRFVLAALESKGLKPVPLADKRALIRRATFDLIGLPPTPEEVDAFVQDAAPGSFARVVDRLLASPHYGERWGRHWLDLARYADGDLGASRDTPFPNAYRYRDWVIRSFNEDLPYDLFVKAQIAGDLVEPAQRERMLPGLGFFALGPGEDDRVDVTGQVFLGLTVGCARCHDHKYDPIPTRDFYSLFGVFKSTEKYEYPLTAEAEVEAYKRVAKQIEQQKNAVEDFVQKHNTELAELLAAKTSRYLMASWDVITGAAKDAGSAAWDRKLDETTLARWIRYLKNPARDHKFLDRWDELIAGHASREKVQQFAGEFQEFVVSIFAEKHAMDDRNYVKLGGAAGVRDERTRQYTNLESLPIEKYYLWRDLASEPYKKDFLDFKGGVYYYGPNEIDRFLSEEWREHHEGLRARLAELKKTLPPQYPFLHTIKDKKEPADSKVYIRGDEKNQGEIAPRRFLSVLSGGEPEPFRNGSGRLELAERIASAANPLFARVMVNRIWQHHFGEGLVRTPSNFGQLGERPTHPELLDYLAARFVEHKWSIKAMHREIMLSAAYQRSSEVSAANLAVDPANRLLWRSNLQPRLDVESLRDALLAVSGELDQSIGGPPLALDENNRRRTVYALVNRTKPDAELAMFDFPNPNSTNDQRMVTVGPMLRLFFMNSRFVASRARVLAGRLATEGEDDPARITRAYLLLYGREPDAREIEMGLGFLKGAPAGGQETHGGASSAAGDSTRQREHAWPQYVQVLLASAEFSSVN